MTCNSGKCNNPSFFDRKEHFSDKKKWYEKINNILIVLIIFIFIFGFIYMAFNKNC